MKYFTWIFFFAALLSGCASQPGSSILWADPSINKVWPAAPAQPRIRLLRSVNPRDLIDNEKDKSRLYRWITGENADILPLVTPYDVATDGQGTIWVTDTGQKLVHIFDLRSGRVDYLTAAGQTPFEMPAGICFDQLKQQLYVSDSLAKKVYRLDREGRLLGEVGSPRIFQRPAGLALDQQHNLYVADVLAGVVHRFSPGGKQLLAMGSSLTENGLFSRPTAVSLDNQGDVYVLDVLNFRVEILGPNGELRGQIGELGDVPGTFSRPRGLALDASGHIYVSDAAFDNVQIFNKQGQLLLYFGHDKRWPLSLPAEMTIDAAGRLIVADSFNHRLLIYQLLTDSAN